MTNDNQEKLPVDNPEFWRGRLQSTRQQKHCIHRSIYNVSLSVWENVQTVHRELLRELFDTGDIILDAGCGYGALFDLLPQGILYHGIDISPDLIDVAKRRHPDSADLFSVGDIRSMSQFSDKHFDYAICRSIDGMLRENLGNEVWQAAERELCRVAKRLILLGYGRPEVYLEFDTNEMPSSDEIERRRQLAESAHDESEQRKQLELRKELRRQKRLLKGKG